MSCARVLLDTNVILDLNLMLARAPFDRPAIELAAAAVREDIVAYVCATSATTIHVRDDLTRPNELGRSGNSSKRLGSATRGDGPRYRVQSPMEFPDFADI